MPAIIDRLRDAAVRGMVGQQFLGCRRDPSVVAADDDIEVTAAWQLVLPAGESLLMKNAAAALSAFCRVCMGVELGTAGGSRQLKLELQDAAPPGEGFRLNAGDHGITISAAGERGLQRGAMRLLHDFAMRRAPLVQRGRRELAPAFTPRIGNTIFDHAAQRLDDQAEQFSDDYLQLMSYFSVNGIHVFTSIWDFSVDTEAVRLAAPGRPVYLDQLRALTTRAAAFGIDVYLTVVAPLLPPETPTFIARPELRGARSAVLDGLHAGHCLCSSQPEVLAFYAATFGQLFRDVSDLGGLILLVGGEGLTHCYTRPETPFEGASSCANCSRRNPSADVAELMNRIADAVTGAAPEAKTFCWPYSAFTWSGDDHLQRQLIERLSPKVSLLSNLASGGRHPETDAYLYDYNIVQIGPGEQFRAQSEILAGAGRPHYAKIECSTTPMMFQIPMIPVPYRWAQRAAAMKAHGVAGYVSHWRFFGFNGSLAEELLSEAVWGDRETDAFLAAYCRREYGEFNPDMLKGWRILSDAWDLLPYSATLCGGRQYYMKGPIYLGPAHPFILDVQHDYGLQRGFRALRGDAREGFADEAEMQRLDAAASPAYESDLLWTMPVGVARCRELLTRMAAAWEDGCRTFRYAFAQLNTAAALACGLNEIVGCHLQTARNLAQFYQLRDTCFSGGGKRQQREAQLAQLGDILRHEIANSERALPLLARDPRLGYGFCYGIVYDARMVEEKIAQCRYVLDRELPQLASQLRFHLDGIFP